jgi:hypothetical protein
MTAMTCPHRPISNGLSYGSGQKPVTWCGRCKEFVAVDEVWIFEYYDRAIQRVRDRMEKQLESAEAEVERDRDYALRKLRGDVR